MVAATVKFPSDREVLVTRQFDAPAELVFDALTKPEHVRVWFGAKELEVCEIDLRVGGEYHLVGFVMDGDAATCSFRGTYLGIERPVRLVGTWVFDGGRMPTPWRRWRCSRTTSPHWRSRGHRDHFRTSVAGHFRVKKRALRAGRQSAGVLSASGITSLPGCSAR